MLNEQTQVSSETYHLLRKYIQELSPYYQEKYGDHYPEVYAHHQDVTQKLSTGPQGIPHILGISTKYIQEEPLTKDRVKDVLDTAYRRHSEYLYPLSYLSRDALRQRIYVYSSNGLESFEIAEADNIRGSKLADVVEYSHVGLIRNALLSSPTYYGYNTPDHKLLEVQEHMLGGDRVYQEYMAYLGEMIQAYRLYANKINLDNIRSKQDVDSLIELKRRRDSGIQLGTGLSINNRFRDIDIDTTKRRYHSVLQEHHHNAKKYKKAGIRGIGVEYNREINDICIRLELKATYYLTAYSLLVADRKGKYLYADENTEYTRREYVSRLSKTIYQIEKEKVRNRRLKLTESELHHLLSGLVLR